MNIIEPFIILWRNMNIDSICLGSFKWSHLISDKDKESYLLDHYEHTDDGFIHVVWWIVTDISWKIYLHHNAKLNEFLLPGGKVDLWESLEDALRRELQEELDINTIRYRYISWVKYMGMWCKWCFHTFIIDEYDGIPLNNESHTLDQYWAKKIDANNTLWFAVSIDGTVTDDVQDIMHSFLDLYHLWYVVPKVQPGELLDWIYQDYDEKLIDRSKSYYLYFNQQKKKYIIEDCG